MTQKAPKTQNGVNMGDPLRAVSHTGGEPNKFVQARKTAKAYQNGMKLFRQILESREYKENFVKRAIHGLLPPAVEIMMFHYILGKPSEQININFQDAQEDLTVLTRPQLATRIEKLHERVKAS